MAGVVRTELYPEIEPFMTGMLPVSNLHTIYYAQCGNRDGKPVLLLHGGPGGGTSGRDRRFFDPAVYRIVLIDQRGSGKSTPAAELKENTTWHLVADIEKLREYLNIEKWHLVFGGSWGSTLSLAYAETHPERVAHLVLRGVFTMRRKECKWIFQEGTSRLFPDIWEKYLEVIPQTQHSDLLAAYYRYLTGDDDNKRLACARAFAGWELNLYHINTKEEHLKRLENDQWVLQFARIECHYYVSGGFFESDSQLIDDVDKIRNIPTVIVQGRYDLCCPVDTAWELHKRWPEADLRVVHGGHASSEDQIQVELVKACERFK